MSRSRYSKKESGCRGTAGGPTSATYVSLSSTVAAVSRHGCWGRQPAGCAWRRSSGSSTTPGSKERTPAAKTTRSTGRSSRRSDFGNSPEPDEDGTGRRRKPDRHPALPGSPGDEEFAMHLMALAVPGCPNVMLLEERLAAAGGSGYLAGAESSAAIRSSAAGTSQEIGRASGRGRGEISVV